MRTCDPTHLDVRRQSLRLADEERERRAGYLDAAERAELLEAVRDEADARALTRRDTHAVLRLPDGALDDASLSTDALRAAARHVRTLAR